MKQQKRLLLVLLIFIVVLGTMVTPVFADASEQDDNGAYTYVYNGESKEISKHKFTFKWVRGSWSENIRNRHHDTQIFQLNNTVDETDVAYAYCSDFLISAVSGSKYKRTNLEESTYYNAAAAEHIRAIINNGYWYTWTDEDLKNAEEKANQWIQTYNPEEFSTEAFLPGNAEEDVSLISGLTRDEALMATQLAIWAFANTEGDGYWIDFYESLIPEGVDPASENSNYDSQDLPANVKAFRKYLIHQQAQPASRDEIIFTDDYFVTTAAVFTAADDNETKYDVTVIFKLAADLDPRDQLVLTAQIGNETPLEFQLPGDSQLTESAGGYYSITFKDIKKRDAQKGISFDISGKQWVNGVSFYEAQPVEADSAREASQNLVGPYNGLTPVHAKASITAEIEDGHIDLYKYDATESVDMGDADVVVNDVPYKSLPGAVFDLYVLIDGDYFLINSGLVTDENGNIHVTGLPDEDYEYYFKEVKAPEGYQLSHTDYIKAIVVGAEDEEQLDPVFVGNCLIPDQEYYNETEEEDGSDEDTEEKETNNEIPEEDGASYVIDVGGSGVQTGDYSNLTICYILIVLAIAVISAIIRIRRIQY